jgi:hypothetical protein
VHYPYTQVVSNTPRRVVTPTASSHRRSTQVSTSQASGSQAGRRVSFGAQPKASGSAMGLPSASSSTQSHSNSQSTPSLSRGSSSSSLRNYSSSRASSGTSNQHQQPQVHIVDGGDDDNLSQEDNGDELEFADQDAVMHGDDEHFFEDDLDYGQGPASPFQVTVRSRGKVKEADFSPRTRAMALLSKELVRKYITLDELFPDNKHDYYWMSIKSEIDSLSPTKAYNQGLKRTLNRVESNPDTRDRMLTFVSHVK